MIDEEHVCYVCSVVIENFKRPDNRECTDDTPGFKEYEDVCCKCKGKNAPAYNRELAELVENG